MSYFQPYGCGSKIKRWLSDGDDRIFSNFAAASGSSLATTGTMGVISSQEMEKASYNKALAGGSVVAGGTLGILIPPSTIFIIFGMLTEQSIGSLLIAGIFSGILLTLMFILTILVEQSQSILN